jgi:hypothetical protein
MLNSAKCKKYNFLEMNKFVLSILILFLLCNSNINSQVINNYESQKVIISKYLDVKGEVYFRFYVSSKDILKELTKIISIDNVKDKVINLEVYAYANEQELNKFLKYNIDFEVLTHPADLINVRTTDNINEIMAWDVYPTYDAYVAMMNSFVTSYPSICRLVNIGTTVQGRSMLFCVISDSVNFRKNKPQFMYTSSIHGDEVVGYMLMLRLIDTLLSGNGVNPKITNLVKNVEIWINPLANPDGTYYGGNNNINAARRYNANNVDLNRNYPDPVAGPHPDGNSWQPETINNMNLINTNFFRLSANFHGGSEVYNYPYDSKPMLHADDAWWIHAGHHYVDTAHAVNSGYMTEYSQYYPYIPGVVNGYAWYLVSGGRQDFMTYFRHGREVTIELSDIKLLPQAQLQTYWGYNFKSFLNYINECLYGLRGQVTDSVTGVPLKSRITLQGYDADSSWINSDSIVGGYNRMVPTGTYTVVCSAPNYFTKTITNIYIKYDSTSILNIRLRPLTSHIGNENSIPDNYLLSQNYPNPFNPSTIIKYQIKESGFVTLKVFDVLGREVTTLVNEFRKAGTYETQFPDKSISANALPSGIYFYKLTSGNFSEVRKMILQK